MKQIDCVFKVRGVRCSSRKVGERVQWLYMQYKAINVCTDWIDLDSRRHKPHTKKKKWNGQEEGELRLWKWWKKIVVRSSNLPQLGNNPSANYSSSKY